MIEPLRCPSCGSERVHACGQIILRDKRPGTLKRMPKIACDACRKVYRADGTGAPQDYYPEYADLLEWK